MLDYRAATLLFAVGILLSVGYLFANTMSELAPEEDQGILFGISRAPQYANLDYIDSFGKQIDETFKSFPETDTRFATSPPARAPLPSADRLAWMACHVRTPETIRMWRQLRERSADPIFEGGRGGGWTAPLQPS
ncbi:hypothetical protein J2847_006025 [Azospirillum agricola]|uniref:hypothetical protein n=1 Tax=Azospirillum agricola TaxID=1720247 RepID=UPI001F1F7252